MNYSTTTFYYLCVGGGGAGGVDGGGGGGAGGVLQGSFTVTGSDTITVSVGTGGYNFYDASAGQFNAINGNGIASSISFNKNTSYNITALGGGRGGWGPNWFTNSTTPGNGGSGGGCASNVFTPAGSGTVGQGNSGMIAGNIYIGGGGGGAGRAAIDISGGAGIICNQPYIGVSGSPYYNLYWGGGGGGGATNSQYYSGHGGNGGIGGGGAGGYGNNHNPPWSTSVYGANGSVNTGGGGGGGAWVAKGGNGGSGIVILAYTPTVTPTYLTTFNLSFSSSSVPTVDLCGNQLTNNNSVAIANDTIRGNVAYMSSNNTSFSTNYATPSTFTRTFWYNPISITSGKNNTVSSKNLTMNFNSSSYLTATFNASTGIKTTISDITNRGTGSWTHYALTYDLSTTTAILYVNGSQTAINSAVYYYGEANTVNAGGICIGDYNATGNGASSYFDYIHVYNTLLSSAQISALYLNETPPFKVLSSTATPTIYNPYTLYEFTSSGSISLVGNKTLYYLVVGGGSSSQYKGIETPAPGGAGGYIQSGIITNSGGATTTYTITVGAGATASGTNTSGNAGSPSSIVYASTTITAAGGNANGTAGTTTKGLTGVTNVTESGAATAGGTASTNSPCDVHNGQPVSSIGGYTLTIGSYTKRCGGGGGGADSGPNSGIPSTPSSQTDYTCNSIYGGGCQGTCNIGNAANGTPNTGGGGGGDHFDSGGVTTIGGSGVVLVFFAT